MRTSMKIIFLIFILSLIQGCSEPVWLNIEIPTGATNKYQDQPFTKFSRQTSFTHKENYPEISMIENIQNSFSSNWEKCTYGENEWQNFEDISSGKSKYIFQRITTWRTKEKDRLLFVVLKYEYSLLNKKAPKVPLNNIQEVSIVESYKPWWAIGEDFNELCQ